MRLHHYTRIKHIISFAPLTPSHPRGRVRELERVREQADGAPERRAQEHEELEERHNRAAGELEGSVPLKRLQAMQEELKHSKRMHLEVVGKYSGLEEQFRAKEADLNSEREILIVVREEVHRTNAELEEERREKEGIKKENVRLRTLSEQLEGRGSVGDGSTASPQRNKQKAGRSNK